MNMMNRLGSALGMLAALTLGGCASTTPQPYGSYGTVDNRSNAYPRYGVVQSIELLRQEKSGIGLGTIAGAVVGGVVGNQVGSGQGNTAATVIGAAGGAYVGHELENRQGQTSDTYRITVRLEDGSYQALTQGSNTGLQVGDRVRIENGTVQRY